MQRRVSSRSNKLPHWLQEAVRAPSKPIECELPPTVLAIAESVCLLLGEQKPAIPPFPFQGPRLSRPKDPRNTPKKRRVHKVQQAEHPKIGSGQGDQISAPAPKLMEAPPTSAIDQTNDAPSLNLNSPSSSSAGSQRQDVIPPAFEETRNTMEVSEAVAAACTARSEAPETGCQRDEFSGLDGITSGSCRSPTGNAPDAGAPRRGLSGPAEFSLLPVVDATGLSTTRAVGPVSSDDQEPEQENLLDSDKHIADTEKLLEKPTPLESRDSGASQSVSAQIVDEDKVGMVADER
ncbi:unnamed protein product [Triticum turgidum subsp. durum]|uniref:Uncharacterized protein n=1 Tax=Triticum turgidum subsp. durum TaxID=4567 RepID=A0A9R1R6F0_TRITD|nr:unnamed protein product [Triticum turgidum subsp. durum]